MTSPKQTKANRWNSKKSTGPKTVGGKLTASKNAVKHGLFSSETLLPWENTEELVTLKNRLIASLKPKDELEKLLVDRIISTAWRLRRAGRIETGMIARARYSLNYEMTQSKKEPSESRSSELAAEEEQKRVESVLLTYPDLPELGLIFVDDTGAFNNLTRYESSLERSLYKAHHELQRLQALRRGVDVKLPVAIDVNGDDKNIENF